MIGGGIQRREVVPVGFNFRAGCDGVAKTQEDLGDFIGNGVDQVTRAHLLGAARQRDVDGIGFHAGLEFCMGKFAFLGFQCCLDFIAGSVYCLAHFGTMLFGNLAHSAQVAGKRTGFAHNLYADLLQRIGVRHFADSRKRIGMQGLDIVDN